MHPKPLLARTPPAPLQGRIAVPGDKSISHRALMFAGLAVGETRIDGLLEGEDVLRTAGAMRALGAEVTQDAPGRWRVAGRGIGGLVEPGDVLDMGNSGTAARLLCGILASHDLFAVMTGDASLRRRPMRRVTDPLAACGATFQGRDGGRLPLAIRGAREALPIEYRLPVASAQVKSALLLAGLNAPGITRVIEPVATRDHSERMLAGFGAEVWREGEVISIRGEAELKPQRIVVPGDPSSAAFATVAALIVAGSEVTIANVGMNPTRAGLYKALEAMGARIERTNVREVGGEPVADLVVRASSLTAIEPDPTDAPSMIDEFPALFVAAAFAEGRSVFRGLEELRVKESDRIAVMAAALRAIGARVEELADGLAIEGSGGEPLSGGVTVATHLDHRIAMSLTVAGLNCRAGVTLDDDVPVATSYPRFFDDLGALQTA